MGPVGQMVGLSLKPNLQFRLHPSHFKLEKLEIWHTGKGSITQIAKMQK